MALFAFSVFEAEEVMFTTNRGSDNRMESKRFEDIFTDGKHKRIADFCGQRLSQSMAKPSFNKMVLVVIDALRHDFIPSIDHKKSVHNSVNDRVEKRMPFTEDIMRTNGVGLVSISATPTVTMPRIKAIISGSLPSYMDLLTNLNAYRFNGENVIENAFKANKRINFFGDETWIDLLSEDLFHRVNGTSSFFATDYTEVDTNVTYCVDRELSRLEDWDVMIMHYLGVDHIGHSYGGYHSKLIPKKLLEMDDIIERVYKRVSAPEVSEPYLLVITGDHGMTDVGNHGGSTPEETDTALIFISTDKTKTNEYEFDRRAERVLQVDIAPTLSALLGLPLPNKSRGKVMINVLNALNMQREEQLCHMYANGLQMTKLLDELMPKDNQMIQKSLKYHMNFIDNEKTTKLNTDFNYKSAIDSYNQYLSSIQMQLLSKMTEKSIFSLLSMSFVLTIGSIVGFVYIEYQNRYSIMFSKIKDFKTFFSLTTLSLNCLLLLSTSFIESQHHFWYYLCSTFIVIQLATNVRDYYLCSQHTIASLVNPLFSDREKHLLKVLSVVLVLVLVRVSHNWNIHFHHDIGQWLSEQQNKRLLTVLVICSLIAIAYLMSTKRFGKQQCLLISGLIWVFLYRSACGTVSSFKIPRFLYVEANIRAKIIYFHVYLIIIESSFKRLRKYFNFNIPFLDFLHSDLTLESMPVTSITLRTICTVWVLLSALFFKVHNIPLLAINIVMEKLVNYGFNGRDDTFRLDLVVSYMCLAENAFYSTGNSNTLSTLDVSPVFVGQDSYQFLSGAVNMTVNTYSLYVYWILMLFIRLKDFLFDMSITVVLRNHLFIWSVLCPKFLYESALTVVNVFVIVFVIVNNYVN